MNVSKVASNVGEYLKTQRNIFKVKRMLDDNFYTKATKLGNGAFEVRGFRPCSDYFSSSSLSGMSDYNVARLSLASESSASCTVKYNPKVGLETVVRDPRLSDTFYKITQKIGGEPKVDESVLKNISGASLETAKKGIEEIKSVIGRVIPTLKDIK